MNVLVEELDRVITYSLPQDFCGYVIRQYEPLSKEAEGILKRGGARIEGMIGSAEESTEEQFREIAQQGILELDGMLGAENWGWYLAGNPGGSLDAMHVVGQGAYLEIYYSEPADTGFSAEPTSHFARIKISIACSEETAMSNPKLSPLAVHAAQMWFLKNRNRLSGLELITRGPGDDKPWPQKNIA